MEQENYDLIIVGAGPVGCVIADRAAREMAWRCLVLEKRPHVAGNCYDFFDENGLLLHRYGPHCFRTWKESLVRYLGAYTEWIPGNHCVRAFHKGRLFPLPINLTTLELFFGCQLLAAICGEGVVPRLAVILRDAPFGPDPTFLRHPV